MHELRRAVGMPIGLPAFSWMVRLGAPLFLRTDPELALYGRYVVSKRLEEEQFEFRFPHLSDALNDLLDRHHPGGGRNRSATATAMPISAPPAIRPAQIGSWFWTTT